MSTQLQVISNYIKTKADSIQNAFPIDMNYDHFIASAYVYLSHPDRRNMINDCTKESIYSAIYDAAQVGLDFVPSKGHAYIVKYGNRATFMPGYRGLIEVATRTGVVHHIDAENVYEQDYFKMVKGTNPQIIHEPYYKGDRGEKYGAYAIAYFRDGGHPLFVYMNNKEIDSAKKKSAYVGAGSPWCDFEDEMRRKTAIKRLYKLLPLSKEMEKAIEFDNRAAQYEFTNVQNSGEGDRTSKLSKMLKPELFIEEEQEGEKPEKKKTQKIAKEKTSKENKENKGDGEDKKQETANIQSDNKPGDFTQEALNEDIKKAQSKNNEPKLFDKF